MYCTSIICTYCACTYVLNHSLDGPFTRQLIERTGPVRVLDKKYRVNGNEAHLLDEQLRFGSAGSLTLVNEIMPPTDDVFQRI